MTRVQAAGFDIENWPITDAPEMAGPSRSSTVTLKVAVVVLLVTAAAFALAAAGLLDGRPAATEGHQ